MDSRINKDANDLFEQEEQQQMNEYQKLINATKLFEGVKKTNVSGGGMSREDAEEEMRRRGAEDIGPIHTFAETTIPMVGTARTQFTPTQEKSILKQLSTNENNQFNTWSDFVNYKTRNIRTNKGKKKAKQYMGTKGEYYQKIVNEGLVNPNI